MQGKARQGKERKGNCSALCSGLMELPDAKLKNKWLIFYFKNIFRYLNFIYVYEFYLHVWKTTVCISCAWRFQKIMSCLELELHVLIILKLHACTCNWINIVKHESEGSIFKSSLFPLQMHLIRCYYLDKENHNVTVVFSLSVKCSLS